jgi:hypothetical protein
MDAIARTNEPWVAYKYDAGLKGFSTASHADGDLARHRAGIRSTISSAGPNRTGWPAFGQRTGCSWQKGRAARSRRSRRRTPSSSRAKWT